VQKEINNLIISQNLISAINPIIAEIILSPKNSQILEIKFKQYLISPENHTENEIFEIPKEFSLYKKINEISILYENLNDPYKFITKILRIINYTRIISLANILQRIIIFTLNASSNIKISIKNQSILRVELIKENLIICEIKIDSEGKIKLLYSAGECFSKNISDFYSFCVFL